MKRLAATADAAAAATVGSRERYFTVCESIEN